MSSSDDTEGEEELSEEELAAYGLALHYIHVMQGPRWRASVAEEYFGDTAEDLFENLEVQLDYTAYQQEKYPQWFQFLATHASTHQSELQNEAIDTKLFLNEGIQELIYDDSIKEILSMRQDLPKVSLLGQRPVKNCRMYLAPNIPTKKLKNGISNDRFSVNGLFKETDVFAMIDEKTMMFAAKNGLMITNIGIFWRSSRYEFGGLPWRINDSRMTGVITVDGALGSKNFAVVIDDDLIFPIGGLGVVYEPEDEVIGALISVMIDIANEQYNSSN
tara:strand:- start:34 stop:858 length:825 start_codon:yes stop_codon:yes gene_type:complete